MARELPYIAAIGEAVHQEMERDEKVLYFGQNLATHDEDPFLMAFGADRVRVTPISETAEIGMAVGLALAFCVSLLQVAGGQPAYYWQIMTPGAILGIIVGYATFNHRELGIGNRESGIGTAR